MFLATPHEFWPDRKGKGFEMNAGWRKEDGGKENGFLAKAQRREGKGAQRVERNQKLTYFPKSLKSLFPGPFSGRKPLFSCSVDQRWVEGYT
jgi:hypothetical protein